MSTIDMTVVSGSLRTLVDARLDAIDRALLGRVSRQERLNVVGEVEARIHELLHDRCGPGVEPSRDDVLAVLARLDPPEAYLAEDDADGDPRPLRTPSRPSPPAAAWYGSDPGRFAWYSGMLGFASLAAALLILASYPAMFVMDNELVFLGAAMVGGPFVMFIGLASAILAAMSRFRNGWAVFGAAAGALSLLFGLCSFGFVLSLFLAR